MINLNDTNIQRIINTINIPQKSVEWFQQREGIITGSKLATLLNKSTYDNVYDFIGRENLTQPTVKPIFTKQKYYQPACDHGVCFEDVVKLLYSHIHNEHILDVGLVRHTTWNLGASPDGLIIGLDRNK